MGLKKITRISLFIAFTGLLAMCNTSTPNIDVVRTFHDSFAQRDFRLMEQVLDPQFTLINFDGDTQVTSSEDYMKEIIGWCDVMNTQWTINEIEEQDNGQVVAMQEEVDPFYSLLFEGPLALRYTYTVSEGRLTSIRYDSLPGHNAKQYTAAVNIRKFQQWVQRYHAGKLDPNHETGRQKASATLELLNIYATEPPEVTDPDKNPTEF